MYQKPVVLEHSHNTLQHILQHRYLVERLLMADIDCDKRIERSRVAIGYNETHLLFADSWDTKYYESNGTGMDVTNAGSRCDKWLIYAWMRDIAYVEMREFEIDDVSKSNPNRSITFSEQVEHKTVDVVLRQQQQSVVSQQSEVQNGSASMMMMSWINKNNKSKKR